MTEDQSMNVIIHAAFRRDLTRFGEALAAFPADSRPRADQLARAWDNFAGQLHHHHQDEETIFFPAFRDLGVDEGLISALDSEHGAMAEALDAAETSMRTLHADPSAGNAAAARAAVATLDRVTTTHLDHEEGDLEPFAALHKRAPQLKQAKAAVRKAHRDGIGTFLSWLVDGAAPATRTALRKEIPAPVLFVITRVAGRTYERQIATAWK